MFFATGSVADEAITIITEDGPPHMIQSSNSGIDLDITIQVLKSLGYQTEVVYAPLQRAKLEVIKGVADVTVPTFFTKDQPNFYVSKPIIDYRPTVFTREPFEFKALKDIQDLRVHTFQGAGGYFGRDFLDMAKQNQYNEIGSMKTLASMLARNRTDVIVLDYYIFYFHFNQLPEDKQRLKLYEHNLINKVSASVGFKDKAMRDAFDQAFIRFNEQGKVKKIVEKYIGAR